MEMNKTTHCIFCHSKLIKYQCVNQPCYSQYQYGSRSGSKDHRSFHKHDLWFHYYPNIMDIFDPLTGKAIRLTYHLTLEQTDKFHKLQMFK